MILDKTRIAIITEFLSDYRAKLTGSHIAKKNRLNQKTVSNVLNELEKENILKSQMQGRNKLYTLNLDNKETVKNFITAIETLKTIDFYKEYPLIKEISSKVNKHIIGSAIIFGSYAKRRARKDSDLDLLIIGKADEKEIGKISEIYKKDISLKIYPRLVLDTLMKEALKDHIIIKGAEKFISAISEP